VTFLRYADYGIGSKTSGPVEAGFERQKVGDDACHHASLLSGLECGCKGLPFIGIWKVGHNVEYRPRVFVHNIAQASQ